MLSIESGILVLTLHSHVPCRREQFVGEDILTVDVQTHFVVMIAPVLQVALQRVRLEQCDKSSPRRRLSTITKLDYPEYRSL